jgi:hypothetical protein|tara:strand:+ start:60 stop:329 length:270 start_codon:yes stop_codon:yes gene_type:complete
MKKFTITIWAYDYHAKFNVESNDDPISLEKAIVDKLGVNDIKWEYLGSSYDDKINRITYEEVINDDATTHPGTLQQEKVTGSQMGARAS